MSAKFGVNVTISAEAARPISVEGVTPIGIAASVKENGEFVHAGLNFYGSVSMAKTAFEASSGAVKDFIAAIYDQAVETPVIVSISESAEKGAIIRAIDELAMARAVTGERPNLLLAENSADPDIASKLAAMAERLKATAIIDMGASDETEAVLRSEEFGTKRVVLCDPEVKIYDALTESEKYMPLSPYVAGVIARTDAEMEYGFSDSLSNRVIQGISGTKRPIEFELGETCEADRLRGAGLTTVIRYDGFRLWGGDTKDPDTIWQDLARVRTFDRVSEACQKGVFFAVDKKASQLYYAKRSVEELLRNLTGAQVLIGYSAEWSSNKNTDATVTQGKFYLDVKMQNNPIVKTIELDFAYVDSYSGKLLADINN